MRDLKQTKRLLLVALTSGVLFVIIPAVIFASSSDQVRQPADSVAGQTLPTRTPVLTDTNWLPVIQNEPAATATPIPTVTVTPALTVTATPTATEIPNGCLPNPALAANNATVDTELANAINSYRSSNGLPNYTIDNRLVQAARRHAQDMGNLSESQLFNQIHTGTDGTTAAQRITQACYNTQFGTEIAGFGFSTVEAMMQWWKDSKTHNGHLLNTSHTDYGPAYANHPNTQYKHFWVVTMGSKTTREPNQLMFHCTYTVADEQTDRAVSVSTWQETPCDS